MIILNGQQYKNLSSFEVQQAKDRYFNLAWDLMARQKITADKYIELMRLILGKVTDYYYLKCDQEYQECCREIDNVQLDAFLPY